MFPGITGLGIHSQNPSGRRELSKEDSVPQDASLRGAQGQRVAEREPGEHWAEAWTLAESRAPWQELLLLC